MLLLWNPSSGWWEQGRGGDSPPEAQPHEKNETGVRSGKAEPFRKAARRSRSLSPSKKKKRIAEAHLPAPS
jgi:hypothetical protein